MLGEIRRTISEVALSRLVIVLGALAFALSGAGSAAAESPAEVTSQITDAAGVLDDGTAAAEEAASALAAEDGLGLYVVFVSSFDSEDPGAWAEASAEISELEETDVLLAVAGDDSSYEYGWWVDPSFPLTEASIQQVMTSEVEPQLDEADRSGAVVALAAQLGSMADTGETTAAEDVEEGTVWSATTTLLIVGAVAVVLLGSHLLSRRRSSVASSQ